MLLVYTYSCLVTIFTTPFAIFFFKNKNSNFYNFSKETIFGIISISALSLFTNFFLPINIYISSIIPLISLLILIKNRIRYFNKKFLIFVLLNGLLISILILESNVYRPDAGLYHLPFIGIINSEKIILGLSNLHSRYAHTSILQYFSAINNNLIFGDKGIVFAQALIASSVMINFSYQIFNLNKKKNYNFHFFYLIIIFVYIGYKMNRYSEYGNDAPAHFLLFFLISELLKNLNKFNNEVLLNNLILSLFIVQNKLTLIVIVFINFISIQKINLKLVIFDKKFLFLSIFFLIWILKNFLTSGCLIYPLAITCFEKTKWSNLEGVNNVSISSEAWTKGWSNKNSEYKIPQEIFIKKFNWLQSWNKVHLKVIIKTLIPYLIFLFLLFLYLYSKKKKDISNNKQIILIFFILMFCSLFWFLKAPLYRYGYSYIIGTIAIFFSYIILKHGNFLNKKKFFNLILIIPILVIFGKNIVRIIETPNNYNNYPWVKYYSMDEKNIQTQYKKYNINDLEILVPLKDYCMYINSVCSHYGIDKNLKIIKYNSYFVIKQ